ncbi:hypothetical protein ACKI1K_07855 [Streptomyces scabiei]|uniref:hypothetical protein n=1 Tax=Streptomyces scabiei TaxID=1930 RepID=UPI0038F6FCEF
MTPVSPAGGDGPATATRLSSALGGTTENTISGGAFYGPAVQAGAIHGGVHVYEAIVNPPIPRQLLPVPAAFTDRIETLDALAERITALPDYAVGIVVVTGKSGIGKTFVANRLLHNLASQYTGGQLYADLRGYTAEGPACTDEVLSHFLRSLRPGAQPTSVDELAAWWRSATAEDPGRRVSLLLDSARDASQVRALLPGGSGHLVVVTSQDQLNELAPDGAVLHELEPFGEDATRQLLTRCLGEQRVAREPGAIAEITRRSAGFPMAIALMVTQLAARPARSLTDVTCGPVGIRSADNLDPQLTLQETAVTTALDRAYSSLPRDTPAPAIYRRMGAAFVVNFDPPMAAAVCDLTHAHAARELERLRDLQLIQAVSDDEPSRGPVYRLHDEARAHARYRATAEAAVGEAEETLRRCTDFFLFNASSAEQAVTPHHRQLERSYLYPPAEPLHFGDADSALAWLDAQQHNLLPAIRAAAAGGLDASTWQLAHAIWPYLRSSHNYQLWSESHDLGLQAARRCGNRPAEIEMLNTWGVALRGIGRFEDAARTFNAVLDLALATQDRRAESQARHEIGATHVYTGLPAQAEQFLLLAREQRAELARTSDSERDQATYTRAVAITNVCLGQAQLARGRAIEAIETLAAARTTLLDVPDPLDAARALAWLARAHAAGGDSAKGEEYGRRAVVECDATRSARWSAHSRELLGHTVLEAGQTDLARILYEEAVGIYAGVSRRDEERVRRHLQKLP